VIQLHRIPAPPLDRFIESLWYCQGLQPLHAKERVLPNGSIGLIINLHEDELRTYDREDPVREQRLPGMIVTGARAEYVVIHAILPETIGVQFRPGGAIPFLPPPANEFHDQNVGLCDVWGDRAAAELREQLLEAETPESKLCALERTLRARMTSPRTPHAAVGFAVQQFGGSRRRTVGEVTAEIGLSPRRFIEIFHQQVGLTPKVFCRLRRFQSALRQAHAADEVDWACLAIECGYFDQAHFIHDFRAFSGITPAAYFAQRTGFQNHVALDT
jgi:AraC-like DNA-binding protein